MLVDVVGLMISSELLLPGDVETKVELEEQSQRLKLGLEVSATHKDFQLTSNCRSLIQTSSLSG